MAHGGLGRMYALFGDRMDDVMSEVNEALGGMISSTCVPQWSWAITTLGLSAILDRG